MEAFFRKNAFFGAMSHEIRTTLAAVTGFHNLLLETSLDPEQHRYVENARTSADTLVSLVNDLVDFSLIEAAEFKLEAMEFDLRTTIEDAMESIALRAFEKGSEVHTLIHASVPESVRGDPARIRRIILNLAGTALDFSSSGEVVLTVCTVEETVERVVVRFDITGFGIDLTPEQLQKLFEPFGSPDAVTSLQYGRTGLELALSKRLTQTMGGQIGFSSITGKGATFWFTVDLVRCPAAARTIGSGVQSIEGMKVLIADPSPSGRGIIVHYLESMGVHCREFENAGDILTGLAAANNSATTCDAVIIALQKVGGIGFEVVERIRKDNLVKSIPLILVTAMGSRGDAVKMKEIGVAAYLTRPLKQYQLSECMRMIRRRNIETAIIEVKAIERPLITRHTIAEEKSGNRFRVLVADDNAANRRTIWRYLDKAGYTCEVAENGADALASFERKVYDFVFLDCEMPVMNGFESASAIRKVAADRATGGRVPLCGMVASTPGAEKQRCITAGMDDCIVKPFSGAQCIAMVEKWAQKSSPRS